MVKKKKRVFRIIKIILLFLFLVIIIGAGLLVFKTAGWF